jgi:hypothetical protein
MSRRPILLALIPLALLALAGCGDDDDTTESPGDTAPIDEPEDVTTSSTEPDDSTEAGSTSSSGDLELPEGVQMIADLTSEEDGETSTITSTTEQVCGFGFLEDDLYTVSWTIIPGVDDPEFENVAGPEIEQFELDVVDGESTGEVSLTRVDGDELRDDAAEVTIAEEGEGARFTFEAESEDGVAFSGEVLCGLVTESG